MVKLMGTVIHCTFHPETPSEKQVQVPCQSVFEWGTKYIFTWLQLPCRLLMQVAFIHG